MNFPVFFKITLLGIIFLGSSRLALSLDYLDFTDNGKRCQKEGRVLLEAQDGLVFEARDGQYYIVSPNELLERKSDDIPFQRLTRKELLDRLKEEFPESRGYNILQKEHFLIVYTTSKAFADWYGQLLEKLYSSFMTYWQRRGVKMDKLPMPMVALIYSNRPDFFRHAASEGVPPAEHLCAYYNKLTNRVVLCDISGIEKLREGNDSKISARAIQTFLMQPNAAYNIALVIHEATHQIGFNCGLHQRFAPYPLWVCEGIALFHEVPDRNDKSGWSIRTKPNDMRLRDLKRYLSKSPNSPLQAIICSDYVLQAPATAIDNYAMAWGLSYYLIMKRPNDFTNYLNKLKEKTPETEDSPEIRLREFEECFGSKWEDLYRDCGDYLRKL